MKRYGLLALAIGLGLGGCVRDSSPTLPVTIQTVDVDTAPHSLEHGVDANSLVVSCFEAGTLCDIDLTTRSIRNRFTVRSGPGAFISDPGAGLLYCLHVRENALAILGGSPLELKRILGTGSISLARGAMRPNTDELWIGDGIQAVHVLNRSMQIKKNIQLGRYPQAIAFSRDGQQAFITLKGENAVAVVDAARQEEIARIKVGIYPSDVVLIGNTACISNYGSHDVSLVDTVSRTERMRIPVRKKPNALAAHKNTLWVSCQQSYRLVAIDVAQGRVIGTIKTTFYPGALVTFADGSLAVANTRKNKVALITLNSAMPAGE